MHVVRTAIYTGGEQRLHRKLVRSRLTTPCTLTDVQVPVMDKNGEAVAIEPWPVLLPRDLLQAICNSQHENLLTGSLEERLHFWQQILMDFTNVQVQPEKTAPLALYGDEVNVFRQSCMCIHVAPALCPQKTNSLRSRYLLCIVPADKYVIAARPAGMVFLFFVWWRK